jgi:hypothetical protein
VSRTNGQHVSKGSSGIRNVVAVEEEVPNREVGFEVAGILRDRLVVGHQGILREGGVQDAEVCHGSGNGLELSTVEVPRLVVDIDETVEALQCYLALPQLQEDFRRPHLRQEGRAVTSGGNGLERLQRLVHPSPLSEDTTEEELELGHFTVTDEFGSKQLLCLFKAAGLDQDEGESLARNGRAQILVARLELGQRFIVAPFPEKGVGIVGTLGMCPVAPDASAQCQSEEKQEKATRRLRSRGRSHPPSSSSRISWPILASSTMSSCRAF